MAGALAVLGDYFAKEYGGTWKMRFRELAELKDLGDNPPDVILATEPVVKELLKHEQIEASTARTFAGDRLVLFTQQAVPLTVARVGDLPMTQFKKFGLGSQQTAAGYYGRQALVSDGAYEKIKPLITEYGQTDRVLAAIRDGSVQLAILFASTVAQQPDLKVSSIVEEDLHQDIRYQAVATGASADKPAVLNLLKLLSEDPETQKLLGSYGYVDRETALIENQ